MCTLENFFSNIIKPENELSNERLVWETLQTLVKKFDMGKFNIVQLYIKDSNVIVVIGDKKQITGFVGVRNIEKYGKINYWIRGDFFLNF